MENLRNQDNIGKKEILVASFGTSYQENREVTIAAIEDAVERAYPDVSVRRCFTSYMILRKLKSRDNIHIDSIEEAMDRAVANGVEDLFVQSTHLMPGFEYHKLCDRIMAYSSRFTSLKIGLPLLSSDKDFDRFADAMADDVKHARDGRTAVILIGHGTEAESNSVYAKLQKVFNEKGYDDIFIGTVEAEPDMEGVYEMLNDRGFEKIHLQPLLMVAGDHANNDINVGWRSFFEEKGYKVDCALKGMGSISGVRDIIVSHIGL